MGIGQVMSIRRCDAGRGSASRDGAQEHLQCLAPVDVRMHGGAGHWASYPRRVGEITGARVGSTGLIILFGK